MDDLNKAVATYEEASALHGDISRAFWQARRDLKERQKELFRRADQEAGGHKELMMELTRRGIISWVGAFSI